MSAHALPDSRAQKVTFGSRVVDWELPGGRTVRLEAVLVYCANCGKEYGYVPKENTTFAFWLCGDCHLKHGAIVGTYALPDAEWSEAVRNELREKFGGRDAVIDEVIYLEDAGELGKALEALLRDSPYPGEDRRPRG